MVLIDYIFSKVEIAALRVIIYTHIHIQIHTDTHTYTQKIFLAARSVEKYDSQDSV